MLHGRNVIDTVIEHELQNGAVIIVAETYTTESDGRRAANDADKRVVRPKPSVISS